MPCDDWPVERPADWAAFVNEPQSDAELGLLRHAVKRSCPFGSDAWQAATAGALGLEKTLRPQGRPGKRPDAMASSEPKGIDVRPL